MIEHAPCQGPKPRRPRRSRRGPRTAESPLETALGLGNILGRDWMLGVKDGGAVRVPGVGKTRRIDVVAGPESRLVHGTAAKRRWTVSCVIQEKDAVVLETRWESEGMAIGHRRVSTSLAATPKVGWDMRNRTHKQVRPESRA